MDRKEIMNTFRMLAQSQGYYSRLVDVIENAYEEEQRTIFEVLEKQNFKDAVDLIMYIEA